MDFSLLQELIADRRPVLLEGAVVERVKRDPGVTLDAHLLTATLPAHHAGRSHLGGIYREYLEVGSRFNLPMVVLTPTWRAGSVHLKRSPASTGRDLNRESVRFMQELISSFQDPSHPVFLGGLLGPANDAYRPDLALSRSRATEVHSYQAERLSRAGVDFLIVETLPALSEALGCAEALSQTGKAYALSFVARRSGHLLDGTPLHQAVASVDQEVSPPPAFFLLNCVHPSIFAGAISAGFQDYPDQARRIVGLQANASALSPEELDERPELHSDPPAAFADEMLDLRRQFGISLLGGCCGTGTEHIAELAKRIIEE